MVVDNRVADNRVMADMKADQLRNVSRPMLSDNRGWRIIASGRYPSAVRSTGNRFETYWRILESSG